MEFANYKDFMLSLQVLHQKSGKFTMASQKVLAILAKSGRGKEIEDVFSGINRTNHGESRIQHCVKYDLNGFCRLITVQHENICLFLFVGDHSSCDEWLDANKGTRFHVKEHLNKKIIGATRVSDDIHHANSRLSTISNLAQGYLWEKLPERSFESICININVDIVEKIKNFNSISTEEDIIEVAYAIEDSKQATLIYDVFDLLRAGEVAQAKSRIDLFKGQVKPIQIATEASNGQLSSGDEVVLIKDIDPELLEHFVRTASFQKWMLYLHPDQRELVGRDFSGPARLLGVSGSGKTSVLIHRSIFLAKKYPNEKVLVLTLNRALAKLIRDLICTTQGSDAPSNLVVMSFWELCRNKLIEFEPNNKRIYWDKTEQTNPFAEAEHIDEIWNEFYECKNNNNDAEILEPLHQTLLARRVFPQDYIRQEFDYLRSALEPSERNSYLKLEREGRAFPLEERYRKIVITSLNFWEKMMVNVGAIDYLGRACKKFCVNATEQVSDRIFECDHQTQS